MQRVCLDRLRCSIWLPHPRNRLDSDIAETFSKRKRHTDKLGVQRAAFFFFSAKLHRVSAEHPVWVKPINHVIVTGNCNEFLGTSTNCFTDSEGGNLCNFSINNACELVKNYYWLFQARFELAIRKIDENTSKTELEFKTLHNQFLSYFRDRLIFYYNW